MSPLNDAGKGHVDGAFSAGIQDLDLLPSCMRSSLERLQLEFGNSASRVDEDRRHGGAGSQLAQKLQTLCSDRVSVQRQSLWHCLPAD